MSTGEKVGLFLGAAAVTAGVLYLVYEETGGESTDDKGADDYLKDDCAILEAGAWEDQKTWTSSQGYKDTQAANAWLATTDPANETFGEKVHDTLHGVGLGFGGAISGWFGGLWDGATGAHADPGKTDDPNTDKQEDTDAKRKAVLAKQAACQAWLNAVNAHLAEDFRNMICLSALRIIGNAQTIITDAEVTGFLTSGQQGLPDDLVKKDSALWLQYIAAVRAQYVPLPATTISTADIKIASDAFNSIIVKDLCAGVIDWDINRYATVRAYNVVGTQAEATRPMSAAGILLLCQKNKWSDDVLLALIRACYFLTAASIGDSIIPNPRTIYLRAPNIPAAHECAAFEVVQACNAILAEQYASGKRSAPWNSYDCRFNFVAMGYSKDECNTYAAIIYNNQASFGLPPSGPYVPA